MAYADTQLAVYEQETFPLGDYVNLLEVTSADNAPPIYVNRKFRAADSSYFMWQSTWIPDPAMDFASPPHPKGDYGDHVAVKVYKGG